MEAPIQKILLLGYGGANNTGADARILCAIRDMREVFGATVEIGIATVDREKMARLVENSGVVRIIQIPMVFVWAIWKAVSAHDLLVLVEGSTFKENWSNGLLYCFLWAAFAARLLGRRCIAYAVDAGKLCRRNRTLTRIACKRMDMIIVRSEAAATVLRTIGIDGPIVVTADTAFEFASAPRLEKASEITVGLAPVEFNDWPVRFQLWGDSDRCYKWPFYFSWDDERAAASERLVSAWRALAHDIVVRRGWKLKLIAMEELDQKICNNILAGISGPHQDGVDLAYAGRSSLQNIVSTLRDLDFLVTSRYHACVLSMQRGVPQMSLYHDERLSTIYDELGMKDYSIPYPTPALDAALLSGFERLVHNQNWVRTNIADLHRDSFMPRCRSNRAVLAHWHEQFHLAAAETAITANDTSHQ